MEDSITVTINAKSACLQGESFFWQGQFPRGMKLDDIVFELANRYDFVRSGVFDTAQRKMLPYHLIYVDGKMILPDEFRELKVYSDVDIGVVPCVTGG